LKLLGRAFDAAWEDISNGDKGAAAEYRRTRLALVILALARNGALGEDEMKSAAIKAMKFNETAARNGFRH